MTTRKSSTRPSKSATSKTAAPAVDRTVFISYGRQDASEFADRLAADLEKRGGYQVWMDKRRISPAAPFDVRIEQGIRASSVVAAVMSRHALRESSICRNEVIFAHNEGKRIVPLRCDRDPNLKPSLLLCQGNWIDFAAGYEKALKNLLHYLSTGDTSVLLAPPIPTVNGFSPFDFGPEIARYFTDFSGREWLNQELDQWLATPRQRMFVLVGEPGIGKSAIAAWLSQIREEQVVGIHFCTHRNTRTFDPREFVASLVSQLSTQCDDYAEAVIAKDPARPRTKASDAFRELVVEPARKPFASSEPRIFIVDSLDEAVMAAKPEEETIVEVLTTHADDLPSGLKILATTRPVEAVLEQFVSARKTKSKGQFRLFELQARRQDNLNDVAKYINGRLHTPIRTKKVGPDTAVVAERLTDLAEGNFLYARMALDALEDGTLTMTDLGRLAPGLASFYGTMFRRTFRSPDVYQNEYLPILKALSVAQGPMPLSLLARVSNIPPECLNGRLLTLRTYLRTSGQGNAAEYSLFHKSLRDWLTTADEAGRYWCEPVSSHRLVANVLHGHWKDNEYALRYLPTHLASADEWDRFADLLSDTAFVSAKCRAGMICGWVTDFSMAWYADIPTEAMSEAFVKAFETDPDKGRSAQKSSGNTRKPLRKTPTGNLDVDTVAPERLRQQLRGALNEAFGHYADWPSSLRASLEKSVNANVMLFLGDTLDMEQRYTEAESVFRKMKQNALETGAADTFARSCARLAYVLEHQDRLAEGLDESCQIPMDLDLSKPHDDDYWWAQHHRGIILRRLGRYAEARKVFERIHDAPNVPGLGTSALHQLGIIDLELGNLKEAERRFEQCCVKRGEAKYNHRRAYEYRRLAQVYALTGRFQEAQHAFDEATRISQDCAHWRYVEKIQQERTAFVEAPLCLMKRPPKTISKKKFAVRFGLSELQMRDTFRVLQNQQAGYLEEIDADSAEPTGKIVRWDIVHRDALWHSAVIVLIMNARGQIALQKRRERDSKGKWDVSVSGHRDVGETDLLAAVRETVEEIGSALTPDRLIRLGTPYQFRKVGSARIRQDLHKNPFSYVYRTNKKNCERASVFIVRLARGDEFTGGGAEAATCETRWLPLEEAVQWAKSNPSEFASAFKQLLHPDILQAIAETIHGEKPKRRTRKAKTRE